MTEIPDDEHESSFDDETVFLNDESCYICDSCGEEIVITLDATGGPSQEYVEDCPVCCHPNVIHVEFDSDAVPRIWSRSEQDLN